MRKIPTLSRYGDDFRFKPADLGKFQDTGDAVEKFEPGCRILGLTRGDFSLIDLIHAVLQQTGSANVAVVTWSAGIKDAHQVRWLRDTNLINSFNIITDHSYKTRQKKYALALEDLFHTDNIRTSEIHAKFTLIWNVEYKVCIRHSMNLNANRTCESFEIDEDEDIFNFYKDFIDHLFDDLPTGFTKSSKKVNASLDRYFNTDQKEESNKWWTEI